MMQMKIGVARRYKANIARSKGIRSFSHANQSDLVVLNNSLVHLTRCPNR